MKFWEFVFDGKWVILGDFFFRFDVSFRVRFRAPPYKWLHGRLKKRFLASAARFGGHGPSAEQGKLHQCGSTAA